MTSYQSETDWIVAEVVRRLRAMTASSVTVSAEPSPQVATSIPPATQLQISDRVITTKTLEGRLTGQRTVLVSKKAVITPAVKDELRKAGITIVREETNGSLAGGSNATSSCSRLVLVNLTTDVDHQGVVSQLRNLNHCVEPHRETDVTKALRQIGRQLRSATDVGAVISRDVDRLLILANRSRRYRAIPLRDMKRLRESLRNTAANVLLIDPFGCGEQTMVESLRLFLEDVPRRIPAELN